MRIQLIFTALLASAVATQAGVLMVERTESAGGDRAVTTSTIRVDQDRVRVDASDARRQHVFIYRADTETMYMINPREKSYHQMTKQDLERVMGQFGGQMAQTRKMMEEQLKNVPPEQRQIVEQMMKG